MPFEGVLRSGDVRMAVGDDSVQADFVQVWCLELQHLVDALSIDLVRCIADFL